MRAKFQEQDSQSRATLCCLYEYDFRWGDWGEYLGQVFITQVSQYSARVWNWESADCTCDVIEGELGDCHGTEHTRRAAKGALRKYLKGQGKL